MDSIERPTITLKALGGFQLRCSNQIVDLPTRKLACLLTYLACAGSSPQPREKLATLLWGSSTEERARHNLRQALSRIRQVLGQHVILSEGESIALAPGVVDCDAVSLGRLTRTKSPTAAAEAARLYDGPLLEDVFVNETVWSDWLIRERERLSECAIGAMLEHGGHELAAGRAATALQFGLRTVALNPFREDAHRLVLASLAATGRTSEAVKHFNDLAAYLQAELTIEPDEETRAVVAGLFNKTGGAPAHGSAGSGQPRSAAPGPAKAFDGKPASAGFAEGAPAINLPGDPKQAPTASGTERSQRRQITILVCGLFDPARRSRPSDPEEMGAQVAAFQNHVAELAVRFGGTVAPSSVDVAHIHFGYPRSDEQDAVQAVRAAVAHVAQFTGGDSRNMQARAGIATGLIVAIADPAPNGVGRTVVIGDATARAVAMHGLAGPGEVIVSHKTRLLVGQKFALCALEVTDAAQEQAQSQAWKICGEKNSHDRLEQARRAPLVGRLEETDLLLRRWEQARRGAGRVVLVSGEAGIGKSRIADDLLQRLDPDGPFRLRNYCASRHRIQPLYPYISRVKWSAGFASAHTPDQKRARLEALIPANSSDPLRDIALLCELLDLPADPRHPLPPRHGRANPGSGPVRISWHAGKSGTAKARGHAVRRHPLDRSDLA